jgi:hypothetical protein
MRKTGSMYVIFIHGPAASGKHTIGARLSEETGLPLFHNHLAVDAAKALFDFGTAPFNTMRAAVWRTAFSEAAVSGRPFIFTFHPEASVEPRLIDELTQIVEERGGRVFFVELTCSRQTILERLTNSSRAQFGKLTDPELYRQIEASGGFEFPALPSPLVTIDTDKTTPDEAARTIAAIRAEKQ